MTKTRTLALQRSYLFIAVIAALMALLLLVVITGLAQASANSIQPVGSSTGNYRTTSGAVGLFNGATGTITLDVPGTPVTATMEWGGRDLVAGGGDNNLTISVNGGPPQTITAQLSDSEPSQCCASNNYVYLARLDASQFNANAVNTVRVSQLVMSEAQGASLTIISEDPSFEERRITTYWGLDIFHVRWTSPYGPNSQLVCQQIDPTNDLREMKITMFVGGVENASRPNAIWYETGTGALPTGDIVDNPGATAITTSNDGSGEVYPLHSGQNQNGLGEYDLFKNPPEIDPGQPGIPIPALSEWVCFQIESFSELGLIGVSAMWHGMVTDLPTEPDQGTAITLSAFSANSERSFTTAFVLILVALVSFTSLFFIVNRRATQN